jgi:uncharacterized membrane protein YeaQ/YmgE (transglycosylase-associated protein family)
MNVVAWIAFGLIAGYTAFHLSPVDESIGASGQSLVAVIGSFAGGMLAAILLGIDPLALRIDMAGVSIGVVGAVVAVVGREASRRRRLERAAAMRGRQALGRPARAAGRCRYGATVTTVYMPALKWPGMLQTNRYVPGCVRSTVRVCVRWGSMLSPSLSRLTLGSSSMMSPFLSTG